MKRTASGVVWAVLNPAYTRLAMQQLAPEINQFPDAAKLVQRMQNMIISVQASSGVDGKFQAICSSVDDANTLGQLLQMGLMYKQYQSKQDNPDMAQLMSQASVTPAGDRIIVHMTSDRRSDGFADQEEYVRSQDVVGSGQFTIRRGAGIDSLLFSFLRERITASGLERLD